MSSTNHATENNIGTKQRRINYEILHVEEYAVGAESAARKNVRWKPK
ncbi:MAG: hypothetical protein ACK5FT_08070 [Sphingomonadales bacterium]